MRPLQSSLIVWMVLAACSGGAPAGPAAPAPSTITEARSAPRGPAPGTDPLATASATITPEDMYRRVAYLASDELRGRDTPSPGLEKAAEYIAGEFRSFGLQPLGDSGTFIQRWPMENLAMDASSVAFEAKGPQALVRPVFGRDFFLLPGASPTTDAPLVFAGTAAPGQMAGSNVAGKVVAFFIPGAAPDDNWGAAASATVESGLAADAAAVILILDPRFESATIARMAAQLGGQRLPKMVVGLRYEVAREIFMNGGAELDQLRSGAVRRSTTGTTVSIRANSTVVRPPNVVAMLPGSDPALEDTYVVVSAHIDHVGVGRPDASGDSIYNGADDDASGTSAVIEVAQAFASLPVKPARSIIFLGVSGEEKGLFGSQYFAKNPPVPREKIVANINIDMVGRNAPDTIVAIGQDYTSLGKTAQDVVRRHPELGLVVAPDPWPQENLFVRSDHFSFAQIGVPPIFFTSGLHAQYHEPSDEVELIDTDKLARVARLVFYLGNAIASDANAPTWTAAGRAVVRRAAGG